MELTAEFWDTQKGLLLASSDGALRFTAAGKAKYTPLFAKHGYSLSSINTCDDFAQKMKSVDASELFEEKFAENTRQFEAFLADPTITAEERLVIERVLRRTP